MSHKVSPGLDLGVIVFMMSRHDANEPGYCYTALRIFVRAECRLCHTTEIESE